MSDQTSQKPIPGNCPICRKYVDFATAGLKGSFAPFCSERCKLIDIGRWADGRYQIAAEVDPDDEGEDEVSRGELRDRP